MPSQSWKDITQIIYMLTTSRTHQRFALIFLSVAVTLVLWLGSKWYYQDWFDNPFKYPAKASSLSATVLMCWAVLLSTRWRMLEDHFGGMDKVYQVHKRIGRWAFFIILAHPLFLAMDRLPDLSGFFGYLWFQTPEGNAYLWGQNLGLITLILMAVLVLVTLWIKLPYHIWKKTHEGFGLVLLLTGVHILVLRADVAAYPLLALWMYAFLAAALIGFVYIRFGYRFFGPQAAYHIAHKEEVGDILELTLDPQGPALDFKPSQFIYLVVHKKGIPREPHPYSIACGYSVQGRIKLGIKQVGDHTRQLSGLDVGDPVQVFGPYGSFSDSFLRAERDCVFIGGGIGVTPFLGMWHVALHSEERIPERDAARKLQEMHPEIIKTWKSPRVAFFYVCRYPQEASFDDDIRQEVTRSHFHGFTAFEERGHHYELYISSKQGRFSAEYVRAHIFGDIQDKNIFLCGPWPMVDALIRQFQDMGVPQQQIIVEDFNLV